MSGAAVANHSFGQLLKQWRLQRNFSQLDLSLASNVSQRHISFLESGRANPSRDMVLTLSTVLNIPLRQQNKMLTAAGFSAVYSEFDLNDPEVAPIRRALEFTLRQQAPYPAFVLDRYWNQIMMNKGAESFLKWLTVDIELPDDIGPNLVKLILHPQGIKKYVQDWELVASHLIHRVHRETKTAGQAQQSQSLFESLLTYPEVEALWRAPVKENWQLPLLNTTFSKDGHQISLFTTLTTLGTPQDITLQELRLECLFPADEETEDVFLALFGCSE